MEANQAITIIEQGTSGARGLPQYGAPQIRRKLSKGGDHAG